MKKTFIIANLIVLAMGIKGINSSNASSGVEGADPVLHRTYDHQQFLEWAEQMLKQGWANTVEYARKKVRENPIGLEAREKLAKSLKARSKQISEIWYECGKPEFLAKRKAVLERKFQKERFRWHSYLMLSCKKK
jgi:hypothetical protein